MPRPTYLDADLPPGLHMREPSSPAVDPCERPLRLPAVIVLAALVLAPTAAMPQDQSILTQTWQHFLDHCGRAYGDPQRYVDDVSAMKRDGLLNVAHTPDGKLAWLSITGTVMGIGYSMIAVGDHQLQSCTTMANLDGNPATSEAMHTAFLEDITTQQELTVAGGAIPETSLGMGGYSGIEAGSYRYAVLGALPKQIVAEIVFSPWLVEFLSVHIDVPP